MNSFEKHIRQYFQEYYFLQKKNLKVKYNHKMHNFLYYLRMMAV